MRPLFACTVGDGSLHPLIPLARAVQAAGHAVAVAEDRRRDIERLGFTFFPAGPDGRGLRELIRVCMPDSPLARADPRMSVLMDRCFRAGSRIEAVLPDLLAVCHAWRPAVLVCEHREFAGWLAAEEAGIPHVAVDVYASGQFPSGLDVIRDLLDGWRARRGLSPDPKLSTLDRYLTLVPFPPGLRHPEAPLPATARRIRPLVFSESGDEPPPDWLESLPPGPVVHASLGTVVDRPDLLAVIADALADEPLTLILVSGRGRDPATLGPLPANVRVARYISHARLLPRCDAIITHAGAGTLIAAIDAGLPLVMVPILGDQPPNAARAAAGAGLVVPPSELTPAAVREATRAVLTEPRYRAGVAALQAEIAALPPVESAVGWLERLGRDRVPPTAVP